MTENLNITVCSSTWISLVFRWLHQCKVLFAGRLNSKTRFPIRKWTSCHPEPSEQGTICS